MASPQTHPLTPLADPTTNMAITTNSTTNPQPTQSQAQTQAAVLPQFHPSHPPISHGDSGFSKRPRDARIVHLILASLGVSAYQERVPIQLLDFAYRYTSSVLGDAVHIQAEGYDAGGDAGASAGAGGGRGKGGGGVGAGAGKGPGAATAASEKEEVSLSALRIAIASRMTYQYTATLPKEFLLGLAKERNKISLGAGRGGVVAQQQAQAVEVATGQVLGGVRLPAEKYCLGGVGWGIRDDWESEGEEDVEMDGVDGENGIDLLGEEDADEDGEGNIEDIFGVDGANDNMDTGGDDEMRDE